MYKYESYSRSTYYQSKAPKLILKIVHQSVLLVCNLWLTFGVDSSTFATLNAHQFSVNHPPLYFGKAVKENFHFAFAKRFAVSKELSNHFDRSDNYSKQQQTMEICKNLLLNCGLEYSTS